MAYLKDFEVLSSMFILCLICIASSFFVEANDVRKDYIVYMGAKTEDFSLSSDHHLGILQQVLEDSTPEESLIISYGKSFNGFAARLTEKESKNIQGMPRVVSVFPSRKLELQTTRSWDFIGLPEPAVGGGPAAESESDIIIGVIDSGIWPESPSFSDDGFSPAPSKWKGVCQGGQNFTCNKKIIGARAYTYRPPDVISARDENGHGSHTASIAAGRKVNNASFFGIANGTARGGAPSARIAVYNACPYSGCWENLILASFDDAIADGVDIISVSLVGSAKQFDKDVIAIGSFHAMAKGILTVQSAGNNGNDSASTASVAPWTFSVAASSTDRRIIDSVVLGDGTTLTGTNINSFTLSGDKFPMVFDGLCASTRHDNKTCVNLSPEKVKGKIVVTDTEGSVSFLFPAGAIGGVTTSADPDQSFVVPLPSVALGPEDYQASMSYVLHTPNPHGTILKSEDVKDTGAPIVVSFSSRGPNPIAKDILKPDITAPGVDILAAYSPHGPISTKYDCDKRSVSYNVLSGTSQSCPHVAGASAYLKSLHPDWSPAAIKSALMTTALPMSRTKNSDGEFAYGAGHLNPVKAVNPGLVYEATKNDYITFMCNSGYTTEQIKVVVGNESFSCPKPGPGQPSPVDVNYPTMSAMVDPAKPFSIKFSRVVTNVGVANSTYSAKVESDQKIDVTVEPNSMSFTSLKEQKAFNVTVVRHELSSASSVSASLVWSDGIHTVRSPIVVYCK